MIAIGTIEAIKTSGDGLRVDVRLHGDIRRDLLIYGPANVIAAISKGQRCIVHEVDGNDVDQFATPIRLMPDNGAHRIIADAIEARSSGGTAAALATKADVDAVNARIDSLQSAFNSHLHSGVTTGAGISGPPTVPAATTATVNGTTVLKAQ